jgi:ABC-type bacteriocin/lantibiotic exporter with double-glycine peptidase domain
MMDVQQPDRSREERGWSLAARLVASWRVPDAAAPVHQVEGEPTAQALVTALVERGVNARVVDIGAGDLRYLALPTMVSMRGNRWALLRSVGRRHARIERFAGEIETVPRAELAQLFAGVALDLSARPMEGPLASRALRILRGHARDLALIAAVLGAATLLGTLPPLLTRVLLDRVIPERSREVLFAVAVASLALGLHTAWLDAIRERAIRRLELRVTVVVSTELLEHVLGLPFAYVQRKRLGDLLQVLSSAGTASQLATSGILLPIFDVATALVYGVLLFLSLPALGASLACLALLNSAMVVASSRRAAVLQEQALRSRSRSAGLLAEVLGAMPTVRALGLERALGGEWLGRLLEEQALGTKRLNVALTGRIAGDGIGQLSTIGVFVIGGLACLEGRLSTGALSANAMLASGFLSAVGGLASLPGKFWSARASLERTREVLAVKTDERPVRQGIVRQTAPRVEVQDVWFRHGPERAWALRSFSLDVEPGEMRILRSASGSGKTTLLRLIAGLYLPDRGSVSIDGYDAHRARERVAYVPQDALLFEGSILENLEMLSHGASRPALFEAAVRTGFAEVVAPLPMQYETWLPTGGGTLSGGERQLLVLTACLASNRPLLLLDEPLRHLDRASQSRLFGADLFRGRTVIVAMHEPWAKPNVAAT